MLVKIIYVLGLFVAVFAGYHPNVPWQGFLCNVLNDAMHLLMLSSLLND